MRNRSIHMLATSLAVFTSLVTATHGTDVDRTADAHVFLAGETVTFPLPETLDPSPAAFRVLNERLEQQAQGPVSAGTIHAGKLPVGWYRVELLDTGGAEIGFTTAAVLEPLTALPPDDSPIAVDIALSWLGAEDQSDWPRYARLARLAGVRWVRDRIHWREMQPEDGPFEPHTKYDDSATIQAAEELQILQVFHTRPKWALAADSNPERPRLDLAKLYAFCKGMAERFEGQVQAWEPWNEGNARNFGGYPISELCALQKAAFLGFKAGDPNLTVCWNPLGGINIESQVQTILHNETWPYYEVYSIHSYDWPHAYEELWTHARNAASGRPIWVTECDRGMTAAPDSDMGDFTPENDRRKAEFVAQSYVRSLYSGASRHFHFILGPYMEGENRTQFGLLRNDLTPRPGYVALAALGRLLAGGECLGRYVLPDEPNVHLYAFRARPGGESRDVLVAWTERQGDWSVRGKERAPWPITQSLEIEAAYDYLGRPLDAEAPAELRPDAVFLVLPEGETDQLEWRRVEAAEQRAGTPSPVVLQFDAPETPPELRTFGWSQEAAYEFAPGADVSAVLTVYNFATEPTTGTIRLAGLPEGWTAQPNESTVELDAMARREFTVRLAVPPDTPPAEGWLTFRGDFGAQGNPVLAIRHRKPPE